MSRKVSQYRIPSFDSETLFVEVRTQTNKPTISIVVLHGLGGDSNSVLPFVNRLLKSIPNAQVISYDLRGHGKSSSTFSGVSIEETGARDIEAICRFLDLKQVVLVGHSIGGIFVQKYLELELSPHPMHTFIICTPLSTLPLTIKRNAWFSLLKQTSKPITHKKRGLADHLKFSNTRDLSSSRLLSDLRHTGSISLPLMYLSTVGWKLKEPKKIFEKYPITLIYGKNDILVKKPKEIAADTQTAVSILQEIDSNHHQPYTKLPQVLTNIIRDTLFPELVAQDVFFSIIIPTLNEEAYVPKLLQDLTQQTFKRFEVIVVDANSQDGTVAKVKSFQDKLTLRWLSSDQANVAAQRNLGSEIAQANWLLFVDADDQLSPDFLNKLYLKIQATQTDSFTCFIKPDTHNKDELALAKIMNLGIQLSLLLSKPLCYGAMFGINKNVFIRLKGFKETLRINEDYDLVERLVKQNYSFQVYSDIKFTSSFSRIRAEGKIKILASTAKIHLKMIAPFVHVSSQDYPMLGGSYYDQKRDPYFSIEKLTHKIDQLTHSQQTKVKNFINSIFETGW